LIILIVMFIDWIVNNLIFYGVTLKSNDLGVNPYLSFTISACLELVADFMAFILIGKFGRKIPFICSLLVAGLACSSIVFTGFNF
jgi:MFS transporter, OCT family, solute carrier family 22 (organic cation transporter), member 4/5